MRIFIGGAWPYANGSLHIGRITALLTGDILARYFRLKGDDVCYVSGSDCHGTPIQIRAKQEKVTPQSITDRYHQEFEDCFQKLGFSYDLYTRTDSKHHKDFVQKFFLELLGSGYIYPKSIEQVFCPHCAQFLPDRFVTGICPNCKSPARGDQCDACSSLLEPIHLQEKTCGICGGSPELRSTGHLFFALSNLKDFLENYLGNATGFRTNAIHLSQRYLGEGLRDRAVTRDLTWGIDVPVEGFEYKKIYVWVEAVLGYLSASKLWAEQNGKSWEDFWGEDAVHYYVHGKDNIPFHTVILPSLLKAAGNYHLPDKIISSEYLTLEGKKFSTSNNWAVWVPDLLERYHPDTIRYFLTVNGPEKRDTDFSWREFINSHNGELLGAFGNFVNRTLVFIQKSFNSKIPAGQCDRSIHTELEGLYPTIGHEIEQGNFKDGLEQIFSLIRKANKYFDTEQPWITVKEEQDKCADTLYTCVQIICNLSNLLEPYLPFSCSKIRALLNIGTPQWEFTKLPPHRPVQPAEILFERIDKKAIEEETGKLQG